MRENHRILVVERRRGEADGRGQQMLAAAPRGAGSGGGYARDGLGISGVSLYVKA